MTPNLYAKPCTMRQERIIFYVHPNQSSKGEKVVNNLTSISYYSPSTEIKRDSKYHLVECNETLSAYSSIIVY